MSERVIAANSTETPEDLLEKVKREHPLIYDAVRAILPEGWKDAPRMAALITMLAVDLVEAYGPEMGGKVAKWQSLPVMAGQWQCWGLPLT